MKKFVLLVLGLFTTIAVYSKVYNNGIPNKNDSITNSLLIAEITNGKVKTKTNEHPNYSNGHSQTKKVTNKTDEVNLNDYGGEISSGLAVGGGGLVGFPIRIYPSPKFAFEAGLYFRTILTLRKGNNDAGLMVAGGMNIFISKYYKSKKEKIKLNGVSIKAGYSLANIPERFFSLGWANESFKKKNKKYSFIFELGGGLFNLITDNHISYSNGQKIQPLIYWKLNWNWYN